MSYCVNCGVELDNSQKACPLCGTEVNNPHEKPHKEAISPYPKHLDRSAKRFESRMLAGVITIIMLLAIGICLIADLIYSERADWSIIAMSALLLGWIYFAIPMLMLRWNALIYIAIDTLSTITFLYVLNMLLPDSTWYLTLAVPLVLLIALLTALNTSIITSKSPSLIQSLACVIVSIGLCVVGIEVILDIYTQSPVSLSWSLFAIVPCAIIAGALLMMDRSVRIKEALKRKLHI